MLPLSATDAVLRNFIASPCPQGPAPSSESVGIPACTFSKGSKSSTPSFLWLSVCQVHFRVRGLIRLVRRGTESHLSCQIQLCALLASKRRERFSIFLTSAWFFFSVILHPLLLSAASLSPLSSCLSSPSCYSPPFFLFPLWVWLKVTLHTGSLSERRERDKGGARQGKGQRWGGG